jgi:uncharacterized protein (UPF0305 family)
MKLHLKEIRCSPPPKGSRVQPGINIDITDELEEEVLKNLPPKKRENVLRKYVNDLKARVKELEAENKALKAKAKDQPELSKNATRITKKNRKRTAGDIDPDEFD